MRLLSGSAAYRQNRQFQPAPANVSQLVPTGPEQRRHFPPLGDGFGRIAPMFQGVLVAHRGADTVSTAMKSTAGSPGDGRRFARRSVPVSGTASWTPMHGQELKALADRYAEMHADRARLKAELEQARADLEQGRPDSGHPMLFDLAVQLLAIIRPTRP